MDDEIREIILDFQRNEITEHVVYQRLSEMTGGKNAEVLKRISSDELRHYNVWAEYSQTEIRPNRWLVWFYLLIARLFSLTFAIKLMERQEKQAERAYAAIVDEVPQARDILHEEAELHVDRERAREDVRLPRAQGLVNQQAALHAAIELVPVLSLDDLKHGLPN